MKIACPPLSEELLRYLEAVFPDHAVDPAQTDPNRALGRAEVVRHLKAVHETQQEEDAI